MPRDALKPEVLEHYLRLAQELAPPTSKGKLCRPRRYSHARKVFP